VRAVRGSRHEERIRDLWSVFAAPAERRGHEEHQRMRLLISALLRPDSCCVDVGANVGDVLGWITAAAPDGRHVAYEPVPALAEDLRGRFPRVDVRAAAVSRAPGTETFTHVLDRASRSGLGARSWQGGPRTETLEVPVVALDSDLPAGCAPALIKIDVEGNEAHVIEGARQTIAEHRPVVMFEHGFPEWSGSLFDLLSDLGMAVFDFDGAGPYDRAGFCAAAGDHRHVNFLAR